MGVREDEQALEERSRTRECGYGPALTCWGQWNGARDVTAKQRLLSINVNVFG